MVLVNHRLSVPPNLPAWQSIVCAGAGAETDAEAINAQGALGIFQEIKQNHGLQRSAAAMQQERAR